MTNGVLSVAGSEKASATAEVTATDQWVTWCKQGGRTMFFLGIMSIIGLGCGLERLVNLRVGRIVPEGFSAKVVAMWKDDKIDELKAECAKDKSMLTNLKPGDKVKFVAASEGGKLVVTEIQAAP